MVILDPLEPLDLLLNRASYRHVIVFLAVESHFLHFYSQNVEKFSVRIERACCSIKRHHCEFEVLELDSEVCALHPLL